MIDVSRVEDKMKSAQREINSAVDGFVGFIVIFIIAAIISISKSGYIFSQDYKKDKEAVGRFFYKDYYKRVDFLINNCQMIYGYENVNYGKTTFRCDDGRLYKEELPPTYR